MSEPQTFKRAEYEFIILSELADGKYEGDQIGPEHTLQQIQVIADLIDAGKMTGSVIRDETGRAVNIGGPRITAHGRERLQSVIASRDSRKAGQKLKTGGKKVAPLILKWIAGIGAAVTAAWLIKRLGLK